MEGRWRPYDAAEHLLAWLRWIDLLLLREVVRLRRGRPGPGNEFQGLYIADADVDRLLVLLHLHAALDPEGIRDPFDELASLRGTRRVRNSRFGLRSLVHDCDDDVEYADFHSALMTHDKVFERAGPSPKMHGAFSYHFALRAGVAAAVGIAAASGYNGATPHPADNGRKLFSVRPTRPKRGKDDSSSHVFDCDHGGVLCDARGRRRP